MLNGVPITLELFDVLAGLLGIAGNLVALSGWKTPVNMTTRKTELMVGFFVILTISATLLLAMKVVNQGFSDNESSYTLYAKFDNIGGLKARSAVKVGGVTVGRVESIYLDPEDFNPVVVLSLSQSHWE